MTIQRALPVLAILFFACSSTRQTSSPSVDPVKSTVVSDRASGVFANGSDNALITVTLLNPQGKPLSGVQIVLAAVGAGAALTAPQLTDAAGKSTVRLSATASGVKTVSATVVGGSTLTHTALVAFEAGPAAKLAFTIPPSNTQAGTAIAPPVQLAVEDAFGNLVLDAGSPIALAVSSDGGSGALSGTTTASAVNGIATFDDISVAQAGRGFALTATSSGLAPAYSATFDVTAGPPAALSFAAQPSVVVTGTAIVPAVQVALNDASGHVDPGARALVTLALGANCDSAAGTPLLSGTLTAAAVSGIATFSDLSVNLAARGCRLVATAPGFGGAVSAAFDVNPGAPCVAQSTLTATPESIEADGLAALKLSVSVRDCVGDLLSSEPIRLSATGTGNLLGTSSGTTSSGGAFTTTMSSTVAETKTITAVVGSGTDAIALTAAVNFTPVAASASISTMTVAPGSVIADGVTTTTIVILANDVDGNPIPGEAVAVSVSGNENLLVVPGAAPSAVASGATGPDGSFTAVLSSTRAETKIITATLGADGVSATLSGSVLFVAGPPSAIGSILVASPNVVAADGNATSSLFVLAADASGNPLSALPIAFSSTGSGNHFSAAIGMTNASGSFSSTLSSTQAEQKTVSAKLGTGDSSITLTAPVSFGSNAAVATRVTLTASPTTVIADGTATTMLTATVVDANGVGLRGQPITLGATGSAYAFSHGGNSGQTASGTTDVDGMFTATLSSSRSGTVVVTATSGTLTASTGVSFVAGPASAAQSSLSASPSTAGLGGSITLLIALADAQGNPIAGQAFTLSADGTNNTFSASGATSGSTLAATTSATGIFIAQLSSSKAQSETISLTLAGGGGPLLTSSVTFSNTTLVLALSLSASPTQITADGATTTTLTAKVVDQNGSGVSNKTVSLSASGSGNTFTHALSSGSTVSGTTAADGTFIATLSSTHAATEVVTATQGALSASTAVTFIAGAPSVPNSTLTATPSSVGVGSASALIVLLVDAKGNPVGGQSFTLSASGTGNTFSAPGMTSGGALTGTTDARGIFLAQLTSSDAQSETVSVTLVGTRGVLLNATVVFVAPTVVPQLALVASPTSLVADGSATTSVTATVTDQNGNGLSGKTVTLSASGSSNTFTHAPNSGTTVTGTTSADGTFVATLSSTRAQSEVIFATSDALHASTPISFSAGAALPANSSLTATPAAVVTGGAVSLVLLLADANGNPVGGQSFNLSASGAGNTFAAVGAQSGSTLTGTTDASGIFVAQLSSGVVQSETISATLSGAHSALLTTTVSFIGAGGALDTTLTQEPPSLTHLTSATFSFVGSGQVSFVCALDGATASVCSSPMTFTGLTVGAHTFAVASVDPLGNRDASPATWSWTIDTTKPSTILDTTPAAQSTSPVATFTFHATKLNCTFACTIDSGAPSACASPAVYSSLADGSHTFTVQATDPAGNVEVTAQSDSWNIYTGPTFTTFSPSSGASGTSVTLTGTNFSGATAVAFNGTPAQSFIVDNATQIRAVVAVGTTSGTISVTAPKGTATSSTRFLVAPSIASFTPSNVGAGTSVVITGLNFTNASAVAFNGSAAQSFTVDSDTQITAVVAAGTTSGTLSVTTPVGTATSSSSFTFFLPPTISTLAPGARMVGSGVTLNGKHLLGATAVLFNGTPVTWFHVDSAAQIRAVVPTGATTGAVSVTTPGGTGTSPSFTVLAPPNVVSYSVASSVSGCTPVAYTVSQAQSWPVDIDVEYDASGNNFSAIGPYPRATQAASAPATDDGVARVATLPNPGKHQTFLWNTSADFGKTSASNVAIRVVASIDGHPGTSSLASVTGLTVGDGLSFAAQTSYAVGTYPIGVAVGDFNSDGKLDVIVTNDSDNTISLLLGSGAGAFNAAVPYAVGSNPVAAAVGDLNGDGKPDVVTVNSGAGTVSVLLGDGSGGFATAVNYSAGSVPYHVAIGDLNGDGKPDLVVANDTSPGGISVLLGRGDGTFNAAVDYAVGGHPYAVAIADLSGDGKLDVVTANTSDDTISVLLGNGDGTFAAAIDVAVGAFPYSVAIGDLNGDGIPDIATASFNSSAISVLLGRGDGRFSTVANYAAGSSPVGVVIGDMNGDGKPDLVVSNYAGSGSVLLGIGDGMFAAARSYGGGANPYSVAIGDMNGDGKLDFVLANSGDNTISVLLNTEPGACESSFMAPVVAATGTNPQGIVVADLNGDGKPDLISANAGGNTISIELGKGNGMFAAAVSYASGVRPVAVAAADLNGDGIVDVVVANATGNSLSVLLGNGDGTVAAMVNYAVGSTPEAIAIADINGDGKPDLLVTNSDDSSVSVLIGNGNGTFVGAVNYVVESSPYGLAVGDINEDGFPDLVTANSGANTISVLLGSGTGTFGSAVSYSVGTSPRAVAIGDFNGDARPDIAVANSGSNTVSLLVGAGDGTFAAAVSSPVGGTPVAIAIGDIDGDGNADIVTANNSTNDETVLLGNGNGTFRSALTAGAGVGPSSIAIGDVNADGKADLLVANGGGNGIAVLLGNGDGTFRGRTDALGVTPSGPDQVWVTIADLNGDGRPDMVAAISASNSVSVRLGNGDGTFGTAVIYAAGSTPENVLIADLNRDGKPDLVFADYNDSTVTVLLATGGGAFAPAVSYPAGSGPQALALGDLNGDGKLDIVVANIDGHVNVLFGTGTGSFAAATQYDFGSDPLSVAVADLNGDGMPDIVVADWVANVVGVLINAGAGTFNSAVNYAAGSGPFAVSVGDVNGDGKPDLVVANSKSNTVSVLLGTGTGTFGAQTTYATGSFPVSVEVADLNADGKLDLVVANAHGYSASVLYGNGNGTFAPAVSYALGTTPDAIAIADLNGDGILDFVAANEGGATVSVLLGH